MWLRVFAPTTDEIAPAAIAGAMIDAGYSIVPHFKGDDLGWTSADLAFETGTPIGIVRYLTKEDKLREDLNAYAGELETMTYSPHAAGLMERVIQTQQLLTIRRPIDHPNEALVDAATEFLARWCAVRVGGFYQIDRRGWFEADGTLLVEEF